MAVAAVTAPWSLRIPCELMAQLEAHLFPGDGDEHGTVIGASLLRTPRGNRLLARQLFLARDGVDYVAGQRGYRMLTADFVRDCALDCAEAGLVYLAVHCHEGDNRVAFSSDDLASHQRGYPALLDILDGPPVGGLVFAYNAVAGDIWLPDRTRAVLHHLEIVGRPIRRISDRPSVRPPLSDERYDRQARLFGDRGQALLASQKIGVIGAGGAGSLLVEYLGRLGVGHLVVVDPDRIEPSNLSRVVGSTQRDARSLLTHGRLPQWLRSFGERRRTPKVAIAERIAKQAQPNIHFNAIFGDVTRSVVANCLVDCDYLFLAADTMQARLMFNAIVHQYLIPGVQVGAKAQVQTSSGDLLDLFSVVRPVIPGQGCLWCNELISSSTLQEEATSPEQRDRQRYVEEVGVHAPSVITLNAAAAAHAANDYLMSATGLLHPEPLCWIKHYPHTMETITESPRRDDQCSDCSSAKGRLGAGALMRLPCRG